MTRTLLATALTVMLATSATAGGMSISLPNLWFPETPDVTVTKDCLPSATASSECDAQK